MQKKSSVKVDSGSAEFKSDPSTEPSLNLQFPFKPQSNEKQTKSGSMGLSPFRDDSLILRMGPDIVQVCKWGLAGMLMGAGWGFVRSKAKQHSYLIELDPQPECFDMDSDAPVLFSMLAKYKHYHPSAYKFALEYTDMVFLRTKEISESRRPSMTDYDMIQVWILSIMAWILMIRNHADDGAAKADIERIRNEIYRMLKEHRLTVRRLTDLTRL
jgi:hypothetical protein